MSITNRSETLSTTPEILEAGSAEGKIVLMRDASADIYIGGDASVSSANGFRVATTDVLSITLLPGDTLYGVAASGTPTVRLLVTRDNT